MTGNNSKTFIVGYFFNNFIIDKELEPSGFEKCNHKQEFLKRNKNRIFQYLIIATVLIIHNWLGD